MAYTGCSSEIPLTTFLCISLYGDNPKSVFIFNEIRHGSEYVILPLFHCNRYLKCVHFVVYRYGLYRVFFRNSTDDISLYKSLRR